MTDEQAFLWRQRLLEERDLKNLTDLHVRILLFSQGAIEAGNDQMSHGEVAAALKVGVRTVGDAYRRARLLGLLVWDAQFKGVHGVRRRIANLYRLAAPTGDAEARPDVRRQSKKPIPFLSKPTWSAQCAEPNVSVPMHVIAGKMEERIARRWTAGQRF